jgi:hypothetical protein
MHIRWIDPAFDCPAQHSLREPTMCWDIALISVLCIRNNHQGSNFSWSKVAFKRFYGCYFLLFLVLSWKTTESDADSNKNICPAYLYTSEWLLDAASEGAWNVASTVAEMSC